jgi:rRNA-processing protein FCF1
MRQVILDTNFILTAIKYKIDFLDGIKFLGLTPIIPVQVIDELKKIIKSSKKRGKFKDHAEIALKILEKKKIKKIDLKHTYVDKGILNYSKKHKEVIIATMDKDLKSRTPNRKLIIRAMKRLELL